MDVTSRTGSLLHTAGVVSPIYRPSHPNLPGRVLAAAAYAVNGSQHAPLATMALCGLIGVLRLEQVLCIDVPTTDLLGRLADIAAGCLPAVRTVTSVAKLLVGEQATAAYR